MARRCRNRAGPIAGQAPPWPRRSARPCRHHGARLGGDHGRGRYRGRDRRQRAPQV